MKRSNQVDHRMARVSRATWLRLLPVVLLAFAFCTTQSAYSGQAHAAACDVALSIDTSGPKVSDAAFIGDGPAFGFEGEQTVAAIRWVVAAPSIIDQTAIILPSIVKPPSTAPPTTPPTLFSKRTI